MNLNDTFLYPLPSGERAFRRDLARAKLMRKSRGGKGEGVLPTASRFPLTRSEASSFAATSPPKGRGVARSQLKGHGR